MTLTLDQCQAKAQKAPWYRSLFILAILSGIFSACYKATDNLVVHTRIVAEDNLTAVSAYLVAGSWVGMVVGIIFSLLLGRRLIDPEFRGIRFQQSRKMHIGAMLTGTISSSSTLTVLLGNLETDPSVVIAFGVIALSLTALWDVRKGQLTLRVILLPILFAAVGCMMAVYTGSNIWETTTISVVGFLVVSQILTAFNEVVEQEGARASDGVNFFIWRWAWLTFTGTILAFTIAGVKGNISLLTSEVLDALRPGWTLMWVVTTMLLVYLSITLRLVAKKGAGAAVSMIILLATCTQILVGIPITLLGNAVNSDIFGNVPGEGSVWLIRSIGVLLVTWSVFRVWRARVRGI